MPKLVVTKPTGERFEISDLSLSDIKELAGLNGHGNGNLIAPSRSSVEMRAVRVGPADYREFFKALTPKAKKFVAILRDNSQGISADNLAEKLGFKSGAQIGGLAGGGMGKSAKKHGVDLSQVYRREVSSENGVRQVLYFPGKDIGEIK
jgi:hypothetical protein